ncbi:MAG: 30S ribosomal protein S20 [Gemmatimonadota bacterium]|nr:30S ribosomal protein S20 [Gemmatimonadota bacterium]MDH5198212.1 30S ribosomal protein S20 [Gemmatimonadota bacterium]
MPRIRSAKKRMRQSAKARERNRQQRASLRTAIKKARTAPAAEDTTAAARAAESQIDRAARKRLIHPNAAARQKSRLAKARAKAKAS